MNAESSNMPETSASVRSATRARLLARARADAEVRGLRPRRRWSTAVIVAESLALAAALVFMVKTSRDSSDLREHAAREESLRVALGDSVNRIRANRDSLLAALTGPSVKVLSLTASTARTARALMFWDPQSGRWTFVAHGLGPLPAGRSYQLWLVTDAQKISVGVLDVGARGDAFVQTSYALPGGPQSLRAIAVTEEPAGGSPQPTSAPIIAATAAGTGH